ncbi:MAG: helix-turn-helix domain-containing protein [Christensenellaceae bacterium]|nr:helix-turn-helix domain-containing protein [Christensenellaceae bacterium]MEA5064642.1 helix-turn-helix domain-containing protein [Eubacteriales bacterium]MEA5068018.1 helix-turn-helix domain-containing protein [Christensenellaceae bacterium]
MFSERLIALRRKQGWSQEMLAERLDVSRQAVGKWESGGSMPELPKLIQLADLFGASLDELVLGKPSPDAGAGSLDQAALLEQLRQLERAIERRDIYEYKSEAAFLGLPLIHVKFSRFSGRPAVARGVIAVGDIALGGFALGGIAAGLISLGGLSAGLLLALGGMALGGVAFGGIAVGALAIGGMALGLYSMGGMAVARELAIGGMAVGRVAIGQVTDGQWTLDATGASREMIAAFIRQHSPGIGEWPARLMSVFGMG